MIGATLDVKVAKVPYQQTKCFAHTCVETASGKSLVTFFGDLFFFMIVSTHINYELSISKPHHRFFVAPLGSAIALLLLRGRLCGRRMELSSQGKVCWHFLMVRV